MNIEGNKKEIEAMEQFHKGNRQEGLRLQEQFAAAFREEYKDKDHCPCKKRVGIMEIVRNVLRFTEHIKNMFQIV